MSIINIIATLHVVNDVLEDVKTEMKKLVTLSQLEKGCIRYNLHEITEGVPGIENTGGQFVVIETWENIDALNVHSKSTHFVDFTNKFSENELKITVQMINQI